MVAISFLDAKAASITVDNSDFAVFAGGSTSGTLSNFVVGNNADRMLVVTVGGEDNQSISSMTYGSQPLTQSVRRASGNTAQNRAEIWYLVNPTSGTADISVTGSNPGNGWALGAISLFGAAQQAPVSTATAGDSGSGTGTISFTTTFANGFTVEAFEKNANASPTAESGQTLFFATSLDGGANLSGYYDQLSVAGIHNQSFSSSSRYVYVGALFAPVPEPSSALLLVLGFSSFIFTRNRRNHQGIQTGNKQ